MLKDCAANVSRAGDVVKSVEGQKEMETDSDAEAAG